MWCVAQASRRARRTTYAAVPSVESVGRRSSAAASPRSTDSPARHARGLPPHDQRGVARVWLDLREEIAGEFESLDAYDALQAALERVAARRREQVRLRQRAYKQRMTPEQRRAYYRRNKHHPTPEQYRERWRRLTPEQREARRVSTRHWYHEKRARTASQRVALCPMCSVVFTQRRRNQVYCSPRCKDLKGYVARWGRLPKRHAA